MSDWVYHASMIYLIVGELGLLAGSLAPSAEKKIRDCPGCSAISLFACFMLLLPFWLLVVLTYRARNPR